MSVPEGYCSTREAVRRVVEKLHPGTAADTGSDAWFEARDDVEQSHILPALQTGKLKAYFKLSDGFEAIEPHEWARECAISWLQFGRVELGPYERPELFFSREEFDIFLRACSLHSFGPSAENSDPLHREARKQPGPRKGEALKRHWLKLEEMEKLLKAGVAKSVNAAAEMVCKGTQSQITHLANMYRETSLYNPKRKS